MNKLVLLVAGFALCGFGCADIASTPDEIEEVSDGKADGEVTRPVGTYRDSATPAANRIGFVMLTTEKTFHYEIYRRQGGMVLPMSFDGVYTFTKSGEHRFIRLKDADGYLVARLEYTLDGETLRLRPDDTSTWQTLERANNSQTYCAAPADCAVQDLPQPRCPGQWVCESNTCVYDCRVPCAAAGGSCVSVVAGACENGIIGKAEEYSCDGGFNQICCLPGAPQAQAGEACKSFGNPTLPDCAPGLMCQPGPIPDTATCVRP